MIGTRILQELLRRGHVITAVAGNPEKLNANGAKVVKGDMTDEDRVAAKAKGA